MIAANDPILRQLPQLSPERLRFVMASAAGLLAHSTSYVSAASVLVRISDKLLEGDPGRSMRGILNTVAGEHQVSTEEIRGLGRCRHLIAARQDAMWRMRQVATINGLPRFSYPQIGLFLNRDHATVIHGVKAHARRLREGAAA